MTIEDTQASSRYYQHEAEATRNRLARGLDELNDRLTPGQVFDEVLTYAKGGGGTFFKALTNAARENPIPSLLIGTGCMLFFAEKMGFTGYGRGGMSFQARGRGNGHSESGDYSGSGGDVHRYSGPRGYAGSNRYSESGSYGGSSNYRSSQSQGRSTMQAVSEKASDLAEGAKEKVSAVGETISGAAQSATDTARETLEGVSSRASQTADQLKQSAQGLGETVQQYSSTVSSQVTETASQLADRAARGRRQAVDVAGRMKDRAATLVEEQPLLVAGIAFAAGAALAAALPTTKTENELMGEASDRIKGTVKDAASERFEAAKSTASQVAQEARSAVKEGIGVDPVEAARNLSGKVKETVASTMGSTSSSSSGEPRPSDLTGMDKRG